MQAEDDVYERILVPTDGSACSDQAVEQGVQLAASLGSTITFLFVMDTIPVVQEGVVEANEALNALHAQGRDIIERARVVARGAGVPSEELLIAGRAADEIARASDSFDLVVMGSHGKGLLQRVIAGSVTEGVLRRIARPLLVIQGNRAFAKVDP